MFWGILYGISCIDSVDIVGVWMLNWIVWVNFIKVIFEYKIDYGGRIFNVGGI